MNVLLISQCSKNALTETRRILDQFAERRGERSWQTPITMAGLQTLRKLLRKSARKNTAVACHWIRGKDHSELMWIVGDARKFNAEGTVPTNTTRHNVLRKDDENNWHQLPLIVALSSLAALLHDMGKATKAFQDRLRQPNSRERNHYRHEWVSVRLFQAFVGEAQDDNDWLDRLANCAHQKTDTQAFEALWLNHENGRLLRDGLDKAACKNKPFSSLPPLAQAVAWLVLTHHRLPCKPVKLETDTSTNEPETDGARYRRFGAKPRFVNRSELEAILSRVDADWNEPRETAPDNLQAYWQFPEGLPVRLPSWRKQAARYTKKLQQSGQYNLSSVLHDPFTMHVSRLCLMLADHHYSGIKDDTRRAHYRNDGYTLYANTLKGSANVSESRLHQTLDEHLLGVQAHASQAAHSLPSLTRALPALKNHRGLKKRSADARFRWQDKAADLAVGVRQRTADQGAFIINMASTGCGKTLGNARIMNALAEPHLGLRCAFAIGLRTLTLQTGRSFQNDLGLDDDQLAIKVGGAANRALFEYWEQQAEASGSASSQELLDEGTQVLYEGNDQHPLLQRLSDDPKVRSLLAAPLLVCTIDHLTPATESLRGGRQIAPMLRLMSGDLVLDEPDDFDMADLPALTRLVHWAGLLGSRVLLSSATLPPALIKGLFLAYLAGRKVFHIHRGERPGDIVTPCCLWIDEFQQAAHDCIDAEAFCNTHEAFVKKRITYLSQTDVRRRARIITLPQADWRGMEKKVRRQALAQLLAQRAWTLHQLPQNHSSDPVSGKQVSFGLMRMANINPLFDIALTLYQLKAPAPDVHIHLCVYHSQFPLLSRSVIEQQLDTVLNRRTDADGNDPVWRHPTIRSLIDRHPAQHHLFIVLGSPVTEVGRDHDYDWAIVEPSSMRSIIQLAGRVRRHRSGAINNANIELLDSNLRHFEQSPGKAAFCKPGFEMDSTSTKTDNTHYFHLQSHHLQELLSAQISASSEWPVDARPRISHDTLRPKHNLTDLEHARMHDAMLLPPPDDSSKLSTERNASLHWHSPECLWLTGLLPQFQRFRYDPQPRVEVAMLPDEDEQHLLLHHITDGDRRWHKCYMPIIEASKLHRIPQNIFSTPHISPWAVPDLLQALLDYSQEKDMKLTKCAEIYATASLPKQADGWSFSSELGFTSKGF